MKTYLDSNANIRRRDIALAPLLWPVTIPHDLREWTPAHAKNNTNTSVKSNKCNYTSVRKDITHINHYKDNESGTIMIVIYY